MSDGPSWNENMGAYKVTAFDHYTEEDMSIVILCDILEDAENAARIARKYYDDAEKEVSIMSVEFVGWVVIPEMGSSKPNEYGRLLYKKGER